MDNQNTGIRQRYRDPEGETPVNHQEERLERVRLPETDLTQQAPAPPQTQQAPPPEVLALLESTPKPQPQVQERRQPVQAPTPTDQGDELETYMCLDSPTGRLEFDLINFREKGKQIKYFSINLTSVNEGQEPMLSQFSLDENSFLALKRFFSQLDWNS